MYHLLFQDPKKKRDTQIIFKHLYDLNMWHLKMAVNETRLRDFYGILNYSRF